MSYDADSEAELREGVDAVIGMAGGTTRLSQGGIPLMGTTGHRRLERLYKEVLARTGTDPLYHDIARVIEKYRVILTLLPAIDTLWARRKEMFWDDD